MGKGSWRSQLIPLNPNIASAA